jgi:2,4-didehydro-3-deoxy-L-rhamnonate hydrolase
MITPIDFALGTFANQDEVFAGIVHGSTVTRLREIDDLPDSVDGVLADWRHSEPLLRGLAGAFSGSRGVPLAELRAQAPFTPRQVYCAGANYREHVLQILGHGASDNAPSEDVRRQGIAKLEERVRNGRPYVFVHSTAGICGPYDDVVLPGRSDQHDWEGELGVVIGQAAYQIPAGEASAVIAGYTIANDLTMRDFVYRPDIPTMRSDFLAAKHGRAFFPVGPFLVPSFSVPDPENLRITLRVNGAVMQDELTSDMLFNVSRLIEYVSSLTELRPGDLLLTGSPAGNAAHHGRFLQPGDVIDLEITGLGAQRNTCLAEELPPPTLRTAVPGAVA